MIKVTLLYVRDIWIHMMKHLGRFIIVSSRIRSQNPRPHYFKSEVLAEIHGCKD